jgi:hypothetical protein
MYFLRTYLIKDYFVFYGYYEAFASLPLLYVDACPCTVSNPPLAKF